MRTIKQLLVKLGACKPAQKKHDGSRAFKTAFINAPWEHGEWVGYYLFRDTLRAGFRRFPASTDLYQSHKIGAREVSQLFRKKKNRIKYWPEVRKRLLQLGVKL
jgi:hypothetical protein